MLRHSRAFLKGAFGKVNGENQTLKAVFQTLKRPKAAFGLTYVKG